MKSLSLSTCCLILLSACATSLPDHFYVLSPQPTGVSKPRTPLSTQITLNVSLPSLVDRAEMVVAGSGEGVAVLEHERWAAPLTDLVTQTLARDIERRRSDVLVADRHFDRASINTIKIVVEVLQMSIHPGDRASIEAHWRILDVRTGKDVVDGDVFSALLGHDGYQAVARGLSESLSLLADRLVGQLPPS